MTSAKNSRLILNKYKLKLKFIREKNVSHAESIGMFIKYIFLSGKIDDAGNLHRRLGLRVINQTIDLLPNESKRFAEKSSQLNNDNERVHSQFKIVPFP